MVDPLVNQTFCFNLCQSKGQKVPNTNDYLKIREQKILDAIPGE